MRGPTQSIVLLLTAALAAAGGFYGARLTHEDATTAPAEESTAIPVVTEPLHVGDLADTAHAFGVVQTRPADAIAMSVSFEAVPKAVYVSVGESVAVGAALVDVEPSPDARLQLRQAEEALASADRAAEQVRRRRDEQLATNVDVATAEQARQAAQTQLDAQKARGVGVARTLVAEKAGIVTAVGAQPGQVVPAGAPLVVVSPDESIELRIGVDPADADRLKSGDAVTVLVPNTTNTLAGTVRQTGRSLNAQRLCDVFVHLNATAGLRLGAFVETTFTRRTVTGLIVPRAATQLEEDEWCVYIVKDGKARRHVVTLGPSDGKEIVITGEGLADGDDVVVERNGELQDGIAVKAEPPEEDDK